MSNARYKLIAINPRLAIRFIGVIAGLRALSGIAWLTHEQSVLSGLKFMHLDWSGVTNMLAIGDVLLAAIAAIVAHAHFTWGQRALFGWALISFVSRFNVLAFTIYYVMSGPIITWKLIPFFQAVWYCLAQDALGDLWLGMLCLWLLCTIARQGTATECYGFEVGGSSRPG